MWSLPGEEIKEAEVNKKEKLHWLTQQSPRPTSAHQQPDVKDPDLLRRDMI